MSETSLSKVVADVKLRAVCPRCENDTWIIDRPTLEHRDRTTKASCAKCGYNIYVS